MVFVCTSQGCISDDEPQGIALSPGDSLPSFSVVCSDGATISTESLKGKKSMIVFFNTSCSDCRQELPVVQQVWETFKNDPEVVIIAISREEGPESVAKYWEENNLTIPYSAQTTREVYSLFAPSVIPRIFISNPQGVITFSSGDSDMPDYSLLVDTLNSIN